MKLKFILSLMFVLMFFCFNISASEPDYFYVPIDITVNGHYIETEDKPFLHEGTTFLPIRKIAELFGADFIGWDSERREAHISVEGNYFNLPIGKSYAYVNGNKVLLDKSSRIVNSRTYVPLRFIAEQLGAEVSWDQKYYTVVISKENCILTPEHIKIPDYTNEHIYWLARIISCESQGEPIEGMIAVGNVVLNRVESPQFPDTIYGVIFDDVGGIQFEPVLNGTIFNEPTQKSFLAAKKALEGENVVGNSLFFLNPKTAQSFWILENRTFHSVIGNHHFYL